MADILVKSAKVTEGADGETKTMTFMVYLSAKASQDVTVVYTTADSETAKNAALAGLDYTETSGTLTIEAGQTKGFIEVEILGDALKEGDEVFNLVLSGPIGAGFAKGETLTGVGTIVDDETVITLKPAKLTEGAEGNTGLMKFEVNLSSKAGQNVRLPIPPPTARRPRMPPSGASTTPRPAAPSPLRPVRPKASSRSRFSAMRSKKATRSSIWCCPDPSAPGLPKARR
jgi:hypothetical protein